MNYMLIILAIVAGVLLATFVLSYLLVGRNEYENNATFRPTTCHDSPNKPERTIRPY